MSATAASRSAYAWTSRVQRLASPHPDDRIFPRKIRGKHRRAGRGFGVGPLQPAVAEPPLAIRAADIAFVVEAEAAQPLLLAVADPEEIVLHRPDAGGMIAVFEVDHRRVAMMDAGHILHA